MRVHTLDIHICAHPSQSLLEDRRSRSPTDKPACHDSTQPLNLDHWNIDHTQSAPLSTHTHTHTHTNHDPVSFHYGGGGVQRDLNGRGDDGWVNLDLNGVANDYWTRGGNALNPPPPKISQSTPQQAKLTLLGHSWFLLAYIWLLKCLCVTSEFERGNKSVLLSFTHCQVQTVRLFSAYSQSRSSLNTEYTSCVELPKHQGAPPCSQICFNFSLVFESGQRLRKHEW